MNQYRSNSRQRRANQAYVGGKRMQNNYNGSPNPFRFLARNISWIAILILLIVFYPMWASIADLITTGTTSVNKVVGPPLEVFTNVVTSTSGLLNGILKQLNLGNVPQGAYDNTTGFNPTDGSTWNDDDNFNAFFYLLHRNLITKWSANDDAIVEAFGSASGSAMIFAFQMFGTPEYAKLFGEHISSVPFGGTPANLFQWMSMEMDKDKLQQCVDAWNANVDTKIVI